MKISENIELINDTLNRSYTELQKLIYVGETETFVRLKLLDITRMSREIILRNLSFRLCCSCKNTLLEKLK